MFAQGSDKKEWPRLHGATGRVWENTDGLVQDCSGSNVLAMELLQSCAKPSPLNTSDRHGGPVGGVGMGDIGGIDKLLSAGTFVGPMHR